MLSCEFKINPRKRSKVKRKLKEESSLFTSTVQLEASKIFKEKFAIRKKNNVEDMERTRKTSLTRIDTERL